MLTFFAVLGVIFLFLIIHSALEKKPAENNRDRSYSNNRNSAYYVPIVEVKKNGIYVLPTYESVKAIRVLTFLHSGNISFFAEFVTGNTPSELFLLNQLITESIKDKRSWALTKNYQHNSVRASFSFSGEITQVTIKLKQDGSIDLTESRNGSIEWYNYKFLEFNVPIA